MTIIDALGKPCPVPVVKARQAISELPQEGGAVQIWVDNAIACENLTKMASGSGWHCETTGRPGGSYAVTITVGTGQAQAATASGKTPPPPVSREGLVVAIGQDAMGSGSEELGRILLKGFVFSLSQLPEAPHAILFFNSGVHLACKDAGTLEDLQAMAGRGTNILVCGTCVDYYGCKDQVAVGEITNMYGIVEAMAGAVKTLHI